jgi:hypothetical protein
MQKIGDVLKNFDPLQDKYISREFQAYGIYLAEKLNDHRRKALYIKLAKQIHRSVLDQALRFVLDSNARNKAALFMWKLKEMGAFKSNSKLKMKSSKL